MKKTMLLIMCSLLIVGLINCNGSKQQPDGNNTTSIGNHVNPDFPEFLVGTWLGDSGGWELVFTPAGTIESAIIEFGRQKIIPNQSVTLAGKGGQPGFFEAGDCNVDYDPDTKTLTADIRMNRIYMDMDDNVLQGTLEYLFSGEVSPEENIWVATKFTTMDIGAYRKDPNTLPPLEPKLTKWTDFWHEPSEGGDPITFTKVEETSDENNQ